MKLTKKFFCPVNGWDCPYFKKDGSCALVDEGDDPVKECDDAGYFYGDDDDNSYVSETAEDFLQKVEEYKRELEHAPRYVNTSGIGPS